MKKRMIEISVCVGLILSAVFSVAEFNSRCENIRDDVLRLHILANSDSAEDQNVKLEVRDALLNCGNKLFSGETNIETAEEILNSERNQLIDAANKVLEDNGFDYTAEIMLTEEYFTTRTYDKYTLPPGNYLALKVILGEGAGHNWWCVMFPPLCIPAATEKKDPDIYFDSESSVIIKSNPDYEIRFKILELLNNLLH